MTTPILIDFIDHQGTIESILADNEQDAYRLITEKLKGPRDYHAGFTIKVSDGQAFLDNLDEDEQEPTKPVSKKVTVDDIFNNPKGWLR